MTKISFIGAGAIGTALSNVVAEKRKAKVLLHTIETEVMESVNSIHVNARYFPSIRLDDSLQATNDNGMLQESEIIFLAIPSTVLTGYLGTIREWIPPEAILVNLAKGFGDRRKTIVRCLKESFPNPVMTMKGPTFAREIINRVPTGFTLGYDKKDDPGAVASLFEGTTVYLDLSDDPEGVEILSILKNIYAIALGIVDAQFNSPNMRFLVLTKAFKEMHRLMLLSGGGEETIFHYCGYGDFTLTALNDLSRNRTLGLLIGKGFFTPGVSHELVLEGQLAVQVFHEKIGEMGYPDKDFPILSALYRVMNHEEPLPDFIKALLEA
ncbi:MAG TPA: NAD(P)H-dependent glycerol-3-phosphate dehydrogenase [Bacteroidales bacterium]|nr:NAD(P)H-dependent glycerol-3-phosphate dehydrogenase [Bacteroidales bacterium]